MASLRQRNETYRVTFRYQGRKNERSLDTRSEDDARLVLHGIERTLHRLHTGDVEMADDVEVGEFILSGGARTAPHPPADGPTLAKARQ